MDLKRSLIALKMSHVSVKADRIAGPGRTEERFAHTALIKSYSTALLGSTGRDDGRGEGSSGTFSGSDSLYTEESSESESEESLEEELRDCAEDAEGFVPVCLAAATFNFFTNGSRSGCQGPSPFSVPIVSVERRC